MHRIQGWTGLRAAVIALGLVAWAATGATAAPLTSNTSGQVDTSTGVSGTNVISVVPLKDNTVDLGSGPTNVSLGHFVITQQAGEVTTYANTPFSFSFIPALYDGTPVPKGATVTISGHLTGDVNGPSSSSVVATFDPGPEGPINLGNTTVRFSLPTGSIPLAPSTSNGGETTVQGSFTPQSLPGTESPVPEPSTIALFLTTVGGLGLRRYVLSRRRPARV